MKTFLEFITEEWRPEHAMKGWMSPSGKAHMISQYDEHRLNHHPEYLAQGGKQGDSLQHAQAKGFVRFGGNVNSMHGFHHFVHYDSNHPQGKATALKALQYMKPHHTDEVTVSGTPGLFKTSAVKRAMKELDRAAAVPAHQALHALRTEQNEMGRKIKAATTGDNESYKILDSHSHTKGSTWQAGGCGVLAHALHKHMPGSKMVDVHNKKTGHTEHVAVQHGDHVYDANGATPAKHYLKKFGQREMKSHHDLELTDHNPARTAKSEISTHPMLVDKTYKHLQKHL